MCSRITFPGLVEPGQFRRILAELDKQALLYRAGGDADRIEMLHPLEHRFDLIQFDFYLFAADCSLNIFEGGRQIAGFVDGIDDGQRDCRIHVAEGGEPHLPQQVVLQVFGGFP